MMINLLRVHSKVVHEVAVLNGRVGMSGWDTRDARSPSSRARTTAAAFTGTIGNSLEPSWADRGSITLVAVVFFLALLAAAGLVVDGGTKLRAAREASAVAEEAARAGAGQIDRDLAYSHGGRFVVDRTAALAAARAYLTNTGHSGSVNIVGAQKIRVTVTISKPTVLLSAIGIHSLQATEIATADLLQGINTPESY